MVLVAHGQGAKKSILMTIKWRVSMFKRTKPLRGEDMYRMFLQNIDRVRWKAEFYYTSRCCLLYDEPSLV